MADSTDKKYNLKGVVVSTSGEKLEFAAIVLNDGALGTTCDSRGAFSFVGISAGEYNYTVLLLGYETIRGVLSVDKDDDNIRFVMQDSGLALESVVVTAQASDVASTSLIGEEAIRHIQPKSLDDLLQLLPGGLTQNPSLNGLGQVALREISVDANNSLGAAVVLDGAQLSNDANLQTMSFTKNYDHIGFGGYDNDQTTAGAGIDLRSISADNIESVEVIRGIPSVEYGNLTSGIVVVNTKVGITPWELKVKSDSFSKLFYVGKGFGLGDGAMNVGVDYSQSYLDPRKKYQGYERITASVGYSTIFNKQSDKPLSFNVKSNWYSNINSVSDDDPQLIELSQSYRNENLGARITVNGDWRLNGWLTKIDYNVSGQVSYQNDNVHSMVYSPDQVVTNVREEGTFEAQMNPSSYWCDYSIEGIPINIYAQLKTNKYIQLNERDFTNFKTGFDYKYDVNKGAGLEYDITYPPQASGSQRLRPRAYYDIPALQNLSYFLENDTKFYMGQTSLKTSVGVRLNALFLDEQEAGRGSIYVAEPRVNAVYSIIEDGNKLNKLSLFAGYGISNKMPTLFNLYPDNTYYDYQNLAYSGSNGYKIAYMTTEVIEDTYNSELKPMTNTKWEVGANFKLFDIVDGSVTYFREYNKNEFGSQGMLHIQEYSQYVVPDDNATDITFTGDKFTYVDQSGTTQDATVTNNVYFDSWYRPDNDTESRKHGIEYTLNFKKFEPLRTSLSIDGAWFHIRRQDVKDGLSLSVNSDKTYIYAAVMPAGSGSINQRFNSNFRFITHIPELELICTTTVQVVWSQKSSIFYEDENGNTLYQDVDEDNQYGVAPVGYYDKQGNYYEWQASDAADSYKSRMIDRVMSYSLLEDVVSPWVMLNFRLTKEVKGFGEISVIANNFLNKTYYHTNEYSGSRSQLMPDMYIGAEIKIKL